MPIGRRLPGRLGKRLARLVGWRRSVQQRDARHDVGLTGAAMTGVAGHHLPPGEAGGVDRGHHPHHPARGPLQVVVVGVLRPVAAALVDVAIGAVEPGRRRKEPHRPHELVDGNALEDLDVLEDLLGHRRPLFLPGLAAHQRRAQQPHRRHRADRALMRGTTPRGPICPFADVVSHYFQLSIALRCSDSGPISASSMRRPFRSVTFASLAFEKALGAPGSVAVAPRCLNSVTAA